METTMRITSVIISITLFLIFSVTTAHSKAVHPAYGLDDTVRELIPSVVLIVGLGDEVTLGTGFVIDEGGLVLTNYHVVEGADEIYGVWDSTINRDYEKCTLTYFDENLDLALLQLPGTGYLPVPVANVNDAEIADDIICFGFPIIDSDDFQSDTFNIAVTRGIISSIQRDNTGEIIEIWTDAAITYGNSGGPLYDIDLEGVIGINNLFATEARGSYNLAIPYSLFAESLSEWTPSSEEESIPPGTTDASEVLEAAKGLYLNGDTASAIEELELVLPSGATMEINLQLAEWYVEVERYLDAYDIYEAIGDEAGISGEYFGVLAYQAGKYERSIEILLPFIADKNDIVYLSIALSYYKLDELTEAVIYAELALDVTESDDVRAMAGDILKTNDE
jgi:hypothetical protein